MPCQTVRKLLGFATLGTRSAQMKPREAANESRGSKTAVGTLWVPLVSIMAEPRCLRGCKCVMLFLRRFLTRLVRETIDQSLSRGWILAWSRVRRSWNHVPDQNQSTWVWETSDGPIFSAYWYKEAPIPDAGAVRGFAVCGHTPTPTNTTRQSFWEGDASSCSNPRTFVVWMIAQFFCLT